MRDSRRCAATAVLTIAAACVLSTGAAAAPVVADRYEADDGTAYTVQADERKARGKATFRVDVERPEGATGEEGVVNVSQLALARRQSIVAGSAIACGAPGAVAVYGTVLREARRVIAVLSNGRRVRMHRRRPPARWRFDGWIVGALVGVRRPVEEVRVFDRAGDRIAVATFEDLEGCPPE